jgi:hypothetical protein
MLVQLTCKDGVNNTLTPSLVIFGSSVAIMVIVGRFQTAQAP